MDQYKDYILPIAKNAAAIAAKTAAASAGEKNKALELICQNLLDHQNEIIEENKKDLAVAEMMEKNKAFIDRLVLDEKRIQGMADSVRKVISLPDPSGSGDLIRTLPNGLRLHKIRVPIGVIGMIYESRPNVTVDAASLTLKSGNAVILRGGKESVHSNIILAKLIREALSQSNIPEDSVQLLDRTEREIVDEMLQLSEYIDLIIPRGGENLIKKVVSVSKIPVVRHDKGVCHVFVDESADKKKAENITINSKVQRPSVCNAIETLLIHENYPYKKELIKALIDQKVEVIADENMRKIFGDLKQASEDDWFTEYLDYKISVKTVSNTEEAIQHINHYGSHHSDSIVTENYTSSQKFMRLVDSAAVYLNASTRFTDGEVFGMGAEIGISTQKLHVRGPMGLDGLTTEKWVIYGDGQIR